MLQFRHHQGEPSLAEAAERHGLTMDEVDQDFGVIATDEEDHLYTILIDAAASERAQAKVDERKSDAAEGVFANVRVEPFDLQE